jgi:NADH-quinone oxidoreductase subunit I
MDLRKALSRFLLVDLLKGLRVTFKQQAPGEIVTEQYPKVRPEVSERFRGAPRLNLDPDTGETLCIACNLCALACPENCIEVGSRVDTAWPQTWRRLSSLRQDSHRVSGGI